MSLPGEVCVLPAWYTDSSNHSQDPQKGPLYLKRREGFVIRGSSRTLCRKFIIEYMRGCGINLRHALAPTSILIHERVNKLHTLASVSTRLTTYRPTD